jgi:hypothetical protein
LGKRKVKKLLTGKPKLLVCTSQSRKNSITEALSISEESREGWFFVVLRVGFEQKFFWMPK